MSDEPKITEKLIEALNNPAPIAKQYRHPLKGIMGEPVRITQTVGASCHQCEVWTGEPVYLSKDQVLQHALEKHPMRFLAMVKEVLDTMLRGHDYSPYVELNCLYDRVKKEEKEKL